jgi:iron complex outermembrane recepter protein
MEAFGKWLQVESALFRQVAVHVMIQLNFEGPCSSMRLAALGLVALWGAQLPVHAQAESFPDLRELRMLSIEELVELEVTTVSRRAEPLTGSPSAVHVVTSEDIRRSGARDIPDALRLATGIHVARAGNHTWSISSRGFNSTVANKMQVLLDGRSVYSPLFSWVFWDSLDTVMEDIDRIEVIRGPGATMWGANAVNGVINIITKDARSTQGTLVSGGGGVGEELFTSVRHGGQIGDRVWYRVYAKGWEREDTRLPDGTNPEESRLFGQTGIRFDGEASPDQLWTIQGDLFEGRYDRFGLEPASVRGGNLLGRWSHHLDDRHSYWVQAYYDGSRRDFPGSYGERRETADIEFQHRFLFGDRHDLLWGMNARVSRDRVERGESIVLVPERRTIHSYSGFLQDRIMLVEDHLDLTLGSKFEHTTLSGVEVQPSARLSWRPTRRQSVWAAVSRAMRTPTRLESDLLLFQPDTDNVLLRGNPDFESEELVAYEAGYRVQLSPALSTDIALFYHDYSQLRSLTLQPDGSRLVTNDMEGETYGFEISTNYQVSEWWRVKTGYSHLRKSLRFVGGNGGTEAGEGEGNDPDHILVVHSAWDLPRSMEFDAVVRYVDALPSPAVSSYTELDLRLAWRPSRDFEAAIVGRDLLQKQHAEFGTTREVARTIYGKLTWNF